MSMHSMNRVMANKGEDVSFAAPTAIMKEAAFGRLHISRRAAFGGPPLFWIPWWWMLPHMGPYLLSCVAPELNGCARIALDGALANLSLKTMPLIVFVHQMVQNQLCS